MKSAKLPKPKLIVILGPTASGKSELAVKLARKFGGEIVSADSRQVYKEMDIGAGKVPRDRPNNKQIKSNKKRIFVKNSLLFVGNLSEYFHRGIRHYLLDVASPKKRFSVVRYQKSAFRAIKKIQQKGKLPIICGGTGFYIQAVVDGIVLPEVKPDWKLRKKLEKKSTKELFKLLRKLDFKRAKNIDEYNPRRLIRAIEIVKKTKKPIPALKLQPRFNVLTIGIKKSSEELKKLIARRLKKRFKQGMVKEVKKLHKSGISWKKLEEFGLEYRWIAKYLQGKINYPKMVEKLQKDIEHFAKRQMTWFKKMEKNQKIHWIRNYKETEKLIKKFFSF